MSQPWLKFYPRDWRGDQSLRAVSLSARGLWMEMLCIMHEASPYGHLVLGGHAVSSDTLARMTGSGVEEISALLIELQNAGVLSMTRKGVIFSRRMVKDHIRSETGRKSVNKRYAQGAENLREKPQPSRSPNRSPTNQKPEARSQNKRENKSLSSREVPDWLPLDEWAGFKAMRAKIRKPLSDRAVEIALRKLEMLREQGHDPAEVLDQSTLNGWQDLYEIKQERRSFGYQSSDMEMPLV